MRSFGSLEVTSGALEDEPEPVDFVPSGCAPGAGIALEVVGSVLVELMLLASMPMDPLLLDSMLGRAELAPLPCMPEAPDGFPVEEDPNLGCALGALDSIPLEGGSL